MLSIYSDLVCVSSFQILYSNIEEQGRDDCLDQTTFWTIADDAPSCHTADVVTGGLFSFVSVEIGSAPAPGCDLESSFVRSNFRPSAQSPLLHHTSAVQSSATVPNSSFAGASPTVQPQPDNNPRVRDRDRKSCESPETSGVYPTKERLERTSQ